MKPTIKIGIVGDIGSGKTTVTDALNSISSEEIFAGTHFSHVDCPDPADHANNEITGNAQMDGVILVCSANEHPTAEGLGKQLMQCRQFGAQQLVVFLNKADMVDDAEILELVEKEVKALLYTYDFAGDDASILIGSALMALNGNDDNDTGITAVRRLAEAFNKKSLD